MLLPTMKKLIDTFYIKLQKFFNSKGYVFFNQEDWKVKYAKFMKDRKKK